MSKKRYTNDRNGVGYLKFYKLSSSKTIFVKNRNAYNNVQPKNVRNDFFNFKSNKFFNKSSCFYCDSKGHTLNSFYM